jgi:hypothetical protein
MSSDEAHEKAHVAFDDVDLFDDDDESDLGDDTRSR